MKGKKKEGDKEDPLKNKEEEIKSLTDSMQRLQAEFENYRKREAKERLDLKKVYLAGFVRDILHVLDDFENALKHFPKEQSEGIRLIYTNLLKTLQAHGLAVIECNGKRFDPCLHEAMMMEKSEEDGKILEELQKGYTFQDIVIRHSKVKVGKRNEDNKENKTKQCDKTRQ